MISLPDAAIKLLLAVLVGGLIGAEREFRHRAAGFRTIIFVCVGCALFTMFSLELGGDVSPVRIAAHMVTGVGFLCAGVILEEGARVVGLTTASTIWLTAALGMGIGGGQYLVVALALVVTMVVLWVFPKLGELIHSVREERTYEVICALDGNRMKQFTEVFEQCGLQVRSHKLVKSCEGVLCILAAYGSPEDHDRLAERLLADPEVQEFRC
jgi:putative Mg2+ transporter-C (MgtC) family protein